MFSYGGFCGHEERDQMLNGVSILKRVRVTFDPRFPIEGEVVGVERADDDSVEAMLIRAPHIEGGTIYFQSGDLTGAEVSFPIDPAPVLN
jgi:hypothetical protein